ncbi:RHS repeat-associated core domain-containing protein [Actinacidiphila alni]|uniref:RHS repeat-associated core domain-containing protein n=1 Tax=Actinacidiphila alni TaxID=380248 RepID=UPI0033EDF0CC
MSAGTRSGKARRYLRGLVPTPWRPARKRRAAYAATTAVVLAVSVALTLDCAPAVQARALTGTGGLGRPDLPPQRTSKVIPVTTPGAKAARAHAAAAKKADTAQADRGAVQRKVAWPAAGSASATLSGTRAATVKAGGLPVRIARASAAAASPSTARVGVRALDQRAADAVGVKGTLLAVDSTATGSTEVTVDYGAFASAYGGGWSGRLHLVRLPACALTTPGEARCRVRTPLDSHNDIAGHSVAATVDLTAADPGAATSTATSTVKSTAPSAAPATVLALEASPGESASGAGDISAAPLSPSATWQAGNSSGSFDWSYDLDTPPPAAGPVPDLTLSYDSAGIDGRTASTNNQSTPLGEGFDLTSSYITRSYGVCDDDGVKDRFDQCWKYDNASLVLNGKSTELVKDDTSGTWRLKDDDASTVTHSTGADNGDQGDSTIDGAGEYWTVVTGEGTTYVFGLNKLPGAGSQRTNSVWTTPVFGDDSGEPGYAKGDAFADRSYNQAWRWNLDYVVDPHGNAMTYWYTAETNYYAKNNATTGTALYTRGGHLDTILYGQRSDTLFTADATQKVVLGYDERCFAADCTTLNKDTAHNWPDVPFDSVCASGATCHAVSPSFFTRKRLTKVETFVRSGAATYAPVDKWDFTEQFLDPGDIGDSSDQTMVLTALRRTGESGGSSLAMEPVTFTYRQLPNRVDATDDILPLNRPRIDTITSETGAITTVSLAPAECVRGSNMPAEDNDHKRCFPQYWHINGSEDAGLDWFHKYPVIAVLTTDPTGHGEGLEHSYSYADPAWHYNDDPFTPADERTWSQFRGYGQVTEVSGAAGTTQSRTVTVYMQGMDGDRIKGSTSTRPATVTGVALPGLTVPGLADTDRYAGFEREQITYNGAVPESVTVSDPWSQRTATQHKSYADIEAYYVRTAKTSASTYLTVPGTWRTDTQTAGYDGYGMRVSSDDTGDTAVSGDETCTRTWYARNAAAGITSLTSRIRTVDKPCSVAETALNLPASTASRGNVLSDVATVFDNTSATTWSPSQTPTKGEATWTGRAAAYPAGATAGERPPTTWQTTSTATYDDDTAGLGRIMSATDAAGSTTTTAYTPADTGPLTKVTITNAKSQKTYNYLDPARGLPLKAYDADNRITEKTYDALGRVTAAWLPNRSRSAGQTANTVFGYHLSATQPSWTSTGTLKADGATYNTSYTIYDALQRSLQTQTPTPAGGRLLTDTRYDSRGLTYETFDDIHDATTAPNGTYTRAEYGEAPAQTETVFDGAERPTTTSLLVYGVQKRSVTTSYTGDSTATTAAAGGSATRTITDALGRTVEERQYAGTAPTDPDYGGGVGVPYTSTRYTYTGDGKQATVTGPDGAKWTYGYDLFGRQTSAADPDKGTTTTGYTADDKVSWTKDAAGRVVISAYDVLGRTTGSWRAPAGADLTSTAEERTPANQLTSYGYDSVAKGLVDTSTRYVGGSGAGGLAYTRKVTAYDSLDRATGTELDLPDSDPLVTSGAVADTLKFSTYYNIDGTQQYVNTPAAGGMGSEIVSTGYDSVGLPTTLSGSTGYVLDTSYSATGQPLLTTLGTSAAADVKKAYITNVFEEGTQRLLDSHVTDQTHPYMLQDLQYSYDDAGNVIAIKDPTTLGGTGAADNQCFAYDGYQRLTESWTPADGDCATASRTAAKLGGASPYWTSYTYSSGGLRSTETQHTTAGDTRRTYCYTGSQPHALTAVTGATSCTGVTPQYGYDATGNTTGRPDGTAAQTLAWDAEGDLGSVSEQHGTTTDTTGYVYDADGKLIIRRNASGETVLYLDGITEVHLDNSGTAPSYWAQRTYSAGGVPVAVRTGKPGGTTLSWIAGDQHGTSSLAVDAATQAVTKRYTTPFGAPRSGGSGNWPDDKGFLGKAADPDTGLTYIGARAYDPVTGRFISVDPALETDRPQTLNGYTYAANNPATDSDPTGERLKCGGPDDPACPTGNGANGSGGYTPPPKKMKSSSTSGKSGDKTTAHNMAVRKAVREIRKQLRAMGVKKYKVFLSLTVPGGGKKNCLYGGNPTPGPSCGNGIPDIAVQDDKTGIYFIWEVKSAGEADKAVKEADWYVKAMRANGDRAVKGWTIGGPYRMRNGDYVIGPEEGSVIYGKPNERKFKRVLSSAPAAAMQGQQARPVPTPTPGPGPGYYPDIAYQPGLGNVPLAQDGGSLMPLIVPIVIIGAPLVGAAVVAGGGEAAVGATTVAVSQAIFVKAA